MKKENVYLGIDIGGTKCSACLGTSEGDIIDRESFPTGTPEESMSKFAGLSRSLMKKHGVSVIGIGVSCGSPLDPEKGVIQSPPNLPGWDEVPVTKILGEEFKVPAFLDNDANAGALAEFSFGAGKGLKNLVFITFGTGCGAGLILDGRIYRGTNCCAGEIGHMRLAEDGPEGYHKRGSMEGFCSGGGLSRLAGIERRDFHGRTILPAEATAKDIAEAAFSGDKLALRIMKVCAVHLGKGLALIVDMLNPQRIIIGSIFLRCEKLLRAEMEATLKKECLPQALAVCDIVPPGLGERVGDYAAISVAHYSMAQGNRTAG